jgi:CubicO group peptidase (beta-lactamase class C family)
VRRLRYLPNSATFRDRYQYNNLMYVTAGYLAGAVAGSTWEDLVRERIFKPLGMTRSTVTVADSVKLPDHAKPHEQSSSGVAEVDFYDYQKFGVGPNGAVNSSVNDMLKYVQFFLNSDQKLLSPASREELWRPVTVVPGGGTYALGWNVFDDRGHKVVSHGGSITGFTAHVTMLPDDRIGIVVLNNVASSFPNVVANGLSDQLLGLKPPVAGRRGGGGGRAPLTRIAQTKPSLALGAYAGDYSHPAYGTIHVAVRGEGLDVAFAALTVELRHFHFDTWEFGPGRGELAQFQLDNQGRVAALRLPLEPAVGPLSFERVGK